MGKNILLVVLSLAVGGTVGYYAGMSFQEPLLVPVTTTINTPTPVPTPVPGPTTTVVTTVSGTSAKSVALHSAMHKLWEDHIIWTRLVILAIVDNVGGKDQAVARLLKNASDMEAALVPYYGAQAAQSFGLLMKDHLTIAAELVTAAKAGDTVKADDADKRWKANADALATFLSTANPTNWPKADMLAMLNDHLVITKQEAVNRITKNYADDVTNFDKIHDQALMMADGLSDGIVKQFPAMF